NLFLRGLEEDSTFEYWTALKRSKGRRLIRLSRQSQVPPPSNLERVGRSLRVAFDQLNQHVSVTRLRLAPAAKHLAPEFLAGTGDELRLLWDMLPVFADDHLPVSMTSNLEGIPPGRTLRTSSARGSYSRALRSRQRNDAAAT